MTTFANWCLLRGVPDMPAAPADVAQFVTDCAPLGIDKVWELVKEISWLHRTNGVADPTAGGPAASAVNEISKIDPPRSWTKDEKLRFYVLPYDLQMVVNRRTEETEKQMRRAQNVAAEARNEAVEALRKFNARSKRKKPNGVHQNLAA